ncbi:recombinase family protein [Glutamicibacter sp.]|uniref:recombinase family protein n=1 Tax=Glutamicibacter sp. TaxID=1931995 RepID=UPI0028BD9B98|nr:recombinase family protein [Glutamicibacter sp.]
MKSSGRLRAILYLRQSISREDSISLELQENAGRQYCDQQGYDVVRVEADPGISGRTWNRPAVQRTVASIENGEADVIVLWKWSRLSRARKDWAVAIDKVESAGGRIESATEQVDVTTSTGRFARGMLAEFAAFESDRIGDTWKEAQKRRIAQGKPANGRKRFGYEYSRETGFTPHPEEAPALQEMYRRFLLGHTPRDLVEYLNDTGIKPNHGYSSAIATTWSAETIMGILDNPFATGRFRHGGQVHRGIHERIISEETWEKYQSRRRARTKTARAESSQYLLTGLIFCGVCGSKAYGGARRGPDGQRGGAVYSCKQASYYKAHRGGYVQEDRIMEHLLPWLNELANEINAAAAAQPSAPHSKDPAPGIRRALIKLDGRRDALTNKMLDGTIPDDVYTRLLSELEHEKERLKHRLQDLEAAKSPDGIKETADLIRGWDSISIASKRELLSRLLKGIRYTAQRPNLTVQIVAKWEEWPNPTSD